MLPLLHTSSHRRLFFFASQVQRRQANRAKSDKRQQLFQLNSIKKTIKERETNTKVKQEQRKSNQEAEKAQPRRLGKLKYAPNTLLLSRTPPFVKV